MQSLRRTAGMQAFRALLLSSLLCIAFYAYRVHQLNAAVFVFLPWNLVLAWIPLGIIALIARLLHRYAWSSWPMLLLTLLWLLFLPNSFYLVSDYIHLQEAVSGNILFDAVMFTMFVFTGLLLGYCSLYIFHLELLKRVPVVTAARTIAFVLLMCSIAIFIGRDLRWNSWDVLLNPSGMLFDLSDRLLSPSTYRDMLGTIALFFAMLASMYYVGWRLVSLARQVEPRDI